jgi:hypothetical protein
MDFLNRAYSQLNDLYRSMTPGSRLTAGLLAVVVVVGILVQIVVKVLFVQLFKVLVPFLFLFLVEDLCLFFFLPLCFLGQFLFFLSISQAAQLWVQVNLVRAAKAGL